MQIFWELGSTDLCQLEELRMCHEFWGEGDHFMQE